MSISLPDSINIDITFTAGKQEMAGTQQRIIYKNILPMNTMSNTTPNSHLKRTPKDTMFVLVQVIILLLFFLLPPWKHFFAGSVAGGIVAALGISLIIWASISLGKSISPFPTPSAKATLITSGVFRYIRHPIYTGFLLFLAGITISSGSVSQLVITILATGFFFVKASYEEKQLEKKYPGYRDYKNRTGKFLPRLKLK